MYSPLFFALGGCYRLFISPLIASLSPWLFCLSLQYANDIPGNDVGAASVFCWVPFSFFLKFWGVGWKWGPLHGAGKLVWGGWVAGGDPRYSDHSG